MHFESLEDRQLLSVSPLPLTDLDPASLPYVQAPPAAAEVMPASGPASGAAMATSAATDSSTAQAASASRSPVQAWIDGNVVRFKVYDPNVGDWVTGSAGPNGPHSGVSSLKVADGVVAWIAHSYDEISQTYSHGAGFATYNPVARAWKVGGSGYVNAGITSLENAGGVVAWIADSYDEVNQKHSVSVGFATYDPASGTWKLGGAGFLNGGMSSIKSADGVVAWIANSYDEVNETYSYSAGFATYDSTAGGWKLGGSGHVNSGVWSLENADGVVAWIAASYDDVQQSSFSNAGFATYDPSASAWKLGGSGYVNADVWSLQNADGVVAWIASSYDDVQQTNFSSAEFATYDPSVGAWKLGQSGHVNSGVWSLETANGVVAWIASSYDDVSQEIYFSAQFSIYDPSVGEWKAGGSGFGTSGVDSLRIVGATVYYTIGATSHTSGYDAPAHAWYSGPTKPLAWLYAAPTHGDSPLSVWFTNLSIGGADWNWTFGDGSSSDLRSGRHTYAASGAYPLTLNISSAEGCDSKSIVIRVGSDLGPLALSPAALPAGVVGVPCTQIIAAIGGAETATLAVSNIQNPIPGLRISTNGTGSLTIGGTPTSAGMETFTVMATDTAGATASTDYYIYVLASGMERFKSFPFSGTGEVSGYASGTLTIQGTAAFSSPTYGTMEGTGSVVGGWSDGAGGGGTFSVTGHASGTDNGGAISGSVFLDTSTGLPYALPPGPYVSGGSLSTSDFFARGSWPFGWSATVVPTATEPFGIAISPAWTATGITVGVQVSGPPHTSTLHSIPFTSVNLYWAGGTSVDDILGPSLRESIPIWWNLAGGTYAINGLPSAPTGATNLLLVARYDGQTVVSALPLAQPVTLSPATLPADTVQIPYRQTITASGTGPITLKVSNLQGAIQGLTVPTGGTGSLTISGTPKSAGTATFTVTATDSAGSTTSLEYSITVNPPVRLGPAALAAGTATVPYSQTITPGGGTGAIAFSVSKIKGGVPGLNVPAGATGSLTIRGTPTAAGTVSFTVTATDAVGGKTSKEYTIAVQQAASRTTLGASSNPSVFGQKVTLTATIAGTSANVLPPTGTVTFKDGKTTLGTGRLRTAGGVTTATLTTGRLAVGNHTLTATYSGDIGYKVSASPAIRKRVAKAGTITTLVASVNPSKSRQNVIFTAKVTASAPGAGTPTGKVTFMEGNRTLGTGTLHTVRGVTTATFSIATLSVGTHTITAKYAGDSNMNASSSLPLSLVVNAKVKAAKLDAAIVAAASLPQSLDNNPDNRHAHGLALLATGEEPWSPGS